MIEITCILTWKYTKKKKNQYLVITPLVILKFLNQGKDSRVHVKMGCTCLLHFSALLWDRTAWEIEEKQATALIMK